MDHTTEKRKNPRVIVRWPVTVFTAEGAIEGETLNITSDGVAVRCDEPLRLNEVYRIFVVPEKEMAIEVRGQVIWSDLYAISEDNAAVAMGICFVEISEEDRQVIMDLASKGDQ